MKSSTRITQALRIFEPTSTIKCQNDLKFGDSNQYEIEIANDFNTRIEAYKLLYKTYVEKEFANPHPSKMWYSIFDAHPNTITIVVKEGGKVCGAITVVIDSSLGLPAEDLYENEINSMRQKNESLAEIISLGISSNARGTSDVLLKLFNFSYFYAREIHSATKFIITVNPRHSFFYTKKLLFSKSGEVKNYNRVSNNPAELLQLDLNLIYNIVENNFKQASDYKKTIYSGFISIRESKKLVSKLFDSKLKMNRLELDFFFRKQKNLLVESSLEVLDNLQKEYPEINLTHLTLVKQTEMIPA